jgi:predicted MarR family transcription regulator
VSRKDEPFDVVQKPRHYNVHPSGVEAVDLCQCLGFNLGNAVKYLFRCSHKGALIEDLKKARWYLERASVHEAVPTIRERFADEYVSLLVAKVCEASPAGDVLADVLTMLEEGRASDGFRCVGSEITKREREAT